ncbi:MAG: GNAT family N-acetyltransferase [Acidobacteria bacterium]|nr:GNAT family N-acetyltransferase [Acidobacteriota bacterium]
MPANEPLNPPVLLTRSHDRNSFDCGVPELNEYLKRYAYQNQKKNAARTYVATRGDRVVGYYTLAYGSVGCDEAPPSVKAGLARYPIPVILLARLAVDLTEKGQGLGAGLLKDALLRTLQAAEIAGLRAMLVHAKDNAAKSFYEKFGFEPSPIDAYHLFLKISEIQAGVIP